MIEAVGAAVHDRAPGDRVGIPWLGWSCGQCRFCRADRENLCPNARFTGYQIDGGYADYAIAHASYCFPMPDRYDDLHGAPLLCAGLIGYRAYRMAEGARRLGIYGFGAAAHIIAQVALHEGVEVYAFVTPGDERAVRRFRIDCSGRSGSSVRSPTSLAMMRASSLPSPQRSQSART